MSHNQILCAFVRKLATHSRLGSGDIATLLALPHRTAILDAHTYLVREGDRPECCCLVVSGYAFRHKVMGDGSRQILAIHMPGEFIDLQNSVLDVADHNVQTLTEAEIAFVPRDSILRAVIGSPGLGRALWTETLIEASIFREWVVNVGRRDAAGRIAHLLCEIGARMEALGLGAASRYDLPLTQEQLADAVGLTSVHVNRVLKRLQREGLIVRERRQLTIPDWQALVRRADFSARYLHLDQAHPDGMPIAGLRGPAGRSFPTPHDSDLRRRPRPMKRDSNVVYRWLNHPKHF